MKFIYRKSQIQVFTLFILSVFGLFACSIDDEQSVIPKTTEEYKTELSAIVSSQKTIVENCIVGYNKGDFMKPLLYEDYRYNYMSALISAENVLAKPDLTIADIFTANKSISAPGKAFNDNVFISDRRPLNDLIAVCDTLYVHTPEGTDPGMAPALPRNKFKTEISAAKSIRDRSTTIDRQVAAAVDSLNIDLEIFQEAIIK